MSSDRPWPTPQETPMRERWRFDGRRIASGIDAGIDGKDCYYWRCGQEWQEWSLFVCPVEEFWPVGRSKSDD